MVVDYALGYVVGVILGDGTLCRHRGHYSIRLNAVSKRFVDKWSSQIEMLTRKTPSRYIQAQKSESWNKQYISRVYSKKWFCRLQELKYAFLSGSWPTNEDSKVSIGLVNGLLDSEGTFNSHNGIRIINANMILLERLQKLLIRYGVTSTIHINVRPKLGVNKNLVNCYALRVRSKHQSLFFQTFGQKLSGND